MEMQFAGVTRAMILYTQVSRLYGLEEIISLAYPHGLELRKIIQEITCYAGFLCGCVEVSVCGCKMMNS